MKVSGAPEVGDLVAHTYDDQRGIVCLGLVLKCLGIECWVFWTHSQEHTRSWHRRGVLRVVNEDG